MHILDWLTKFRWKSKDFAEMLGCSVSHASLLVNGRRKPSPKMISKIIKVTSGNVRRVDMLEFWEQNKGPPPKKRKKKKKAAARKRAKRAAKTTTTEEGPTPTL